MNRQQRRHPPKAKPQKKRQHQSPGNQLRTMPTFALLAAVNEIIEILRERGAEVRDWDHKEKIVRKMSSIGGKLYVLATAGEATEAEKHGEENRNMEPGG